MNLSDDGDDIGWFSSAPLSEHELRHMRQNMARIEHIKPLIDSYEKATTIEKFLAIVGAWMVGASVGLLGVLTALKGLGWWPFKGG